MNILITGGLGYIGGRVASYLKERVPESSIFLTTRYKNKTLPSWTEKFTVLQMNLLDENSIADCLKDEDIDAIIHLAASCNEIKSLCCLPDDFKTILQEVTACLHRSLKTSVHLFISLSMGYPYPFDNLNIKVFIL